MAERRHTIRVSFRKRIRFRPLNSEFWGWGYTSNLSRKGIRIEAFNVLPPCSKVLIHIHMGRHILENGIMEEILRLEGVVVWVSLPSFGTFSRMGIKILNSIDGIDRVRTKALP